MDETTVDAVLRYMKNKNRPYSAQNVFDNLRGEYPKAKVLQALEKIFCAKQPGFSDAEEAKDLISSLKQAVEGKQEKLRDLRSSLESAYARISPLETHARLVEKTATLFDRIASLEQQLKSIDRPEMEENESAETLELRVKYLDTQVVQRRRMATRMIAEICEQCGFSRAELAGDLGLDMCYDKSRDA